MGSAPHRPHEEETRLWFEKADEDLGAAQDLLAAEAPKAGAIAFHCQQAVEKYLKGVLVYYGYEPPRTHNLRNLLGLAVQFESALIRLRHSVDYLSPFAVDVRYPGTGVSATRKEAVAALQHAQRLRKAVRSCLSF